MVNTRLHCSTTTIEHRLGSLLSKNALDDLKRELEDVAKIHAIVLEVSVGLDGS